MEESTVYLYSVSLCWHDCCMYSSALESPFSLHFCGWYSSTFPLAILIQINESICVGSEAPTHGSRAALALTSQMGENATAMLGYCSLMRD